MLPKILRDIIEWNDIAQVPINSDSMKLYKKLIDEEYAPKIILEKSLIAEYENNKI